MRSDVMGRRGCARHGIMACDEFIPSRWLVVFIAAGVMVALLPGMTPIDPPVAVGVAAFAFFMAIINASIKPIVHGVGISSIRVGSCGPHRSTVAFMSWRPGLR